jgi:hypothetical protein
MNRTFLATSTVILLGFASIASAQEQHPATPVGQTAQSQTTRSQVKQYEQSTGQTFFEAAPRLVRAATSQPTRYLPSTYEFTLTVPPNAGQPLKAVKISQAQNQEVIDFDVKKSKAFLGEKFGSGPEIPLASTGGSQPSNSEEVTIVFDQPVQAGSTVTVALDTNRNPRFSGVYQFGVTAYPDGENGRGQFLGYQRVTIYDSGPD